MKAMIMNEYMHLEYVDVPIPKIKDDEVLVRVKVASVCGSDIHGLNGRSRRRQPPIIMGHEASGIIEEIGKDVHDYAIGDRVTFDSTIYCQECDYCRNGEINLCDSRMVLGVSCDEYRKHGTYAEFVAVPAHILYRLSDEVTYEQASLVEPMSVALHGISIFSSNTRGSVVVFGTGTIALFVVQILKIYDYSNIIVVGRNQKKLALAKELGAHYTINSNEEDVALAIAKITSDVGTDLAFDAVGTQQTFSNCMNCLRKGGEFVTIANLSEVFQINMTLLITKQLTLRGSCASNGEFSQIIQWLKKGKIRTDYVISDKVPLSNAADYFLKLYNKEIPDFYKLLVIP